MHNTEMRRRDRRWDHGTVRRLRACGTRVPMLHDFASFCCQLSTANDDLPCDVSVVVQRYSWRVDCVYLLRMSPLLMAAHI